MSAGTNGVPIIHPAHPYFRFLFLAALCIMTFGSYWCYDIPDAIQTQITKKYDLSPTHYALLYSVYNFMNIGVVLFGGYFIDVIGLRIGSILFCFLIALGQVVFSFGSNFHNVHTAYVIMLLGRVIFSLGGESLSVAQSTFTSKWFKGSELAFAFGITLSFSRIGSFANLNITPILADNWGVSWAIWGGSVTCLISLLITVFASTADKVRDKHLKENIPASDEKPKIPFRFRDILHFPPSVWIIYMICVCYYVPIFTLVSISGLPYVESIFGYSDATGNRYLSIPYFMSAVLAPFCGFAVDKVGRKPAALTVATAFMVGSLAITLYLFESVHHTYIVIIAMILLGLSYSLCAASLWPCIALLVPEERVGTAYAIMNSIQNGGLAIAGVVAAQLTQKCHGTKIECQRRPIEFLALVAIAALAFCVMLFFYDLSHGKTLSAKPIKTPQGATDVDEKTKLLANKDTSINI